LPVVADRDRENREKLGPLRETVRESERKKREELLNISPLSEAVTECRKLIKDFERYKNRAENIQIGYFALPVDQAMLSNYSVYVRNPIDLSTIRTKLGECSTAYHFIFCKRQKRSTARAVQHLLADKTSCVLSTLIIIDLFPCTLL
jgi:Bromodomain